MKKTFTIVKIIENCNAFIKPLNTDYYETYVVPSGSYIGAYTNLVPSCEYEWTGGVSGTAPTKYLCIENSTDKTTEGN